MREAPQAGQRQELRTIDPIPPVGHTDELRVLQVLQVLAVWLGRTNPYLPCLFPIPMLFIPFLNPNPHLQAAEVWYVG